MSARVELIDRAGCGYAPGAVITLVEAVLDAEGVSGTATVVFADERLVTELNAGFRGLDEPTDVLSFRNADGDDGWPEWSAVNVPGDDDSTGSGGLPDLGEVIVCPAVVRGYAEEDRVSPGGRLAWTIVHGVLHLVGYDHERDRGEMRDRERALVAELEPLVREVARLMDD